MKVNPIVQELSRGLFFFDIQSINIWGLKAAEYLSGNLKKAEDNQAKAIVSLVDEKGKPIQMDDKTYKNQQTTLGVVDLIGPIMKYGDWCNYGALEIAERIEQLNDNDAIEAIILNLDGPGGSVGAVAPFLNLKSKKKKPIVGYADTCASAHYYIASGLCDHIMAQNNISSQIGSIGIVLSFYDNKEYLEKLGYKFHEIYPEESKDKNDSFRLALEGKYDMIKKEMLSPKAIQFQEHVMEHRPNLKKDIPGILTGKTFYAKEALEYGLIDSIGSFSDAVSVALALAEINQYK